jgi:hypothetical protein
VAKADELEEITEQLLVVDAALESLSEQGFDEIVLAGGMLNLLGQRMNLLFRAELLSAGTADHQKYVRQLRETLEAETDARRRFEKQKSLLVERAVSTVH